MISDECVEQAFRLIEQAAAKGERCPLSYPYGPDRAVRINSLKALAFQGRVRFEIGGYNFRVAEILVGPHAGKRTLADPEGGRVYRTLDIHGVKFVPRPPRDPRPSRRKRLTQYPNSDDVPSPRIKDVVGITVRAGN